MHTQNLDPDRSRARHNEMLGQLVQLMVSDPNYARASLRNLEVWVLPPLFLEQIKIFYSNNLIPQGYVIWALFSADTVLRLMRDEFFVPNIVEWNEGKGLWIVDLLIYPSVRRDVRSFIFDELGKQFGDVHWLRRRRSGSSRFFFTKRR